MWLARPVVPVPFLVVAVSGRPFHEVFAGSSISCLSAIGGWIVTEKLLLFSLTVVSAVFGGCKTASGGSPSSTGFEPGADEAADPSASTLLLTAELATTLRAALGFPSKWLIVLLDHAKREWAGECVGALWPQVHTPTRIVLYENETCLNQSFLRIYIREVCDVKTTKHIYVIRNASSVD